MEDSQVLDHRDQCGVLLPGQGQLGRGVVQPAQFEVEDSQVVASSRVLRVHAQGSQEVHPGQLHTLGMHRIPVPFAQCRHAVPFSFVTASVYSQSQMLLRHRQTCQAVRATQKPEDECGSGSRRRDAPGPQAQPSPQRPGDNCQACQRGGRTEHDAVLHDGGASPSRPPQRQRHPEAEQQRSQGDEGIHGCPPTSQEIGRPPDGRDEQADVRDIRVTVSHSLRTDLDQPDHRNERPEEPEPADGEVGPPLRPEHQGRDRDQHIPAGPPAPEAAARADEGRTARAGRPDSFPR